MVVPLAAKSVFAAASACVLLQMPRTYSWSSRARVMCCLFAAYLPTYFCGAEYRAAPWRSSVISRFCQACSRWFLPKLFNLCDAVIEQPEELKACKQYILSVHPHGVLSLDHILTIYGFDAQLEKVAPQARRSALSANILFKLPFVRELSLCLGAVDASRKTAIKCLEKGLSLSVVPGGEREQLLAQRGPVECCVLKKRQGFVRLALMFGVPVVPVYCFGEAQLYHQSEFMIGFRCWVQRTLGAALVLPYGPNGIPGLPFQDPMCLVVGSPLEMPKIENPSQEDVDKHHQRYMTELEGIFARHKEARGYKDVELQLL